MPVVQAGPQIAGLFFVGLKGGMLGEHSNSDFCKFMLWPDNSLYQSIILLRLFKDAVSFSKKNIESFAKKKTAEGTVLSAQFYTMN